MSGKADFLKECISDPALVEPGRPVPLDAFTQSYCVRCDNRSCARAGANNILFDRRVNNWQKDLFDSPPRAEDSDQQYVSIRAKNFASAPLKVGVPGTPSFVTVKSPEAARPVVSPPPPPAPPPQVSPRVVAATPEVPKPVGTAPVSVPAVIPTPNNYSAAGQSNTAFQQGTFLPGAPEKPSEETVTQTGATFTFGDDE